MGRISFIAFAIFVWFTSFTKAEMHDYKVLRVIDGDTLSLIHI